MSTPGATINILSIDLEEYFHPTEVQPFLRAGDWELSPSRIEFQTARILELLDAHGVKATFFVLGWLADRYPQLIRTIAQAGHELASHSYAHQLVYELSPEQFRLDTQRSIDAIGSACGVRVRAYRAPSYSITKRSMWALDILADCGFTHDSSIYPISHDRYGIAGFPRHAHTIVTAAGPLLEVPVAAVDLGRQRMAPVGGGGYLRLLPYRYTAAGIRRINADDQQPACVYFHPWEIDPNQPRLATGLIARLRTYTGLASMMPKLDRLLSDFQFSTMTAVHPVPAGQHTLSAMA